MQANTSFPLGPELWRDTRIELTDSTPSLADLFTGQSLNRQPDGSVLVGDVLSVFPVAVLVST
jgi:maltooligosyltrehalose synthase